MIFCKIGDRSSDAVKHVSQALLAKQLIEDRSNEEALNVQQD